jgi:outer membrane protein TolC
MTSMKTRAIGAALTALAVLLAVPSGVRAQAAAPAAIPAPLATPTPNPNPTPLPYPAYGTPAPDVSQLTQKPGVPPVVNLAQAEKIAVALSPVFQSENAQWAAIHAKYTSEKQALLPSVTLSGSIVNNQGVSGNTGTITQVGPTPIPFQGQQSVNSTQEQAGLSLQQLIFDGGRVIAAIRTANEADIAGRGTLLRSLETLQINVASAYYGVLQDNATVTADVQLVKEFETNEASVAAQIRNGAAARSDLAGAQFQTAQARGNLVTAQGVAIGEQALFATTLGLDADALILPQQVGEETGGANPTYQASLKKALVLRPDYLAAQYTVYSSQDNERYAKLARAPVITGTAGYGVQRDIGGSVASNGMSYSTARNLGLAFTVPIYDQGQTNYNVAVAASELDQANAGLIQTRLQVESDVRSALANLISARANLTQAKAEQRAAQVSLDATQAQYKVGANTILGLVTAEANLSTAVASYITALYGVRTSYQNFLYATGASDLQL